MKKRFEKYSVLMSVYAKDRAEFLDRAIQSMVDQTVEFCDLVLVCDGPLTESLDFVIEEWKKKLQCRLNIVRLNENHGLGYALNKGLEKCECDIVARMDSDDISKPFRCEILLNKLNEEKLDLVGGWIEEFNVNPGDMGVIRDVPENQNDIKKYLKKRNPFNHMSVIFNKSAVLSAGGYQHFPWLEDYWLWARMIINGCRCANVSNVVVDVRTGNGMYKRRSGIKYFYSQVNLFRRFYSLGLIDYKELMEILIERLGVVVLPACVIKFCYNKYFRL